MAHAKDRLHTYFKCAAELTLVPTWLSLINLSEQTGILLISNVREKCQ